MRSRSLRPLLAVLAAPPQLAAAPSPAPAAAGQVQVVEKEYSLTLSRLRVHSGK